MGIKTALRCSRCGPGGLAPQAQDHCRLCLRHDFDRVPPQIEDLS